MTSFLVDSLPGFSPQIGRLLSMMNYARATTMQAVGGLTEDQLDYLHDAESNTIGALLTHAAAVEIAYQVLTFEGRDLNEEENNRWAAALDLGEAARREIKSHPLDYYTDLLQTVRSRTSEEFSRRNDEWLYQQSPWGPGTANKYFMWFHVMEDELSHRGQIRWLRKRLPR